MALDTISLQVLRNSRQFRKVYDEGRSFHTTLFSVFILKNNTGERRFGITVTKKIGSAVVRNRCKRRLKEVIRNYFSEVAEVGATEISTTGYDLVVNVRQGLLTADFKQIEESFSRVMERFHKSQDN